MISNGNDEVKYAFKFEFLENITNRMNTIPIERFTKRLKQNSKDACIYLDKMGNKNAGIRIIMKDKNAKL
jgi:hypothetical protein